MSPGWILACAGGYFVLLLLVAAWAGRGADTAGYFLGNRRSPWWLVAFGVIGDSLSGVTFISVPGEVGSRQYAYLQVVLGYVLGYVVIAEVLLPLYYRMNLTSIYAYLGGRFDLVARRTGAAFFLVSRVLGAAARLYLAVSVFQRFVFDRAGIPFELTTAVILGLMLGYTYRGGIKTLVWTDLFQSVFLVLGLVLSLVVVGRALGLGAWGAVRVMVSGPWSQVFFWDPGLPSYFPKQFISGALIAIVMTGLDQNSMQKNLSCRSLAEARRNIYAFVPVLVLVNALFLGLGALLQAWVAATGTPPPARSDLLFPTVALGHLGVVAGVVFILGLTAATFNSADSVLTTLTTSFCHDFLGHGEPGGRPEAALTRERHWTHVGFAVVLLAVMVGFKWWSRDSVISLVLKMAGYTYGPLLGLFSLGLGTRVRLGGGWIIPACVLPPVACGILDARSAAWFGGYQIGIELLLLNGMLTAVLLVVLARRTGRFFLCQAP